MGGGERKPWAGVREGAGRGREGAAAMDEDLEARKRNVFESPKTGILERSVRREIPAGRQCWRRSSSEAEAGCRRQSIDPITSVLRVTTMV